MAKKLETRMKRILLYSPVQKRRYFSVMRFYRSDVHVMRAQGCRVLLANTLRRVILERYDSLIGYFYTWSVIAVVLAKLRGRHTVLTGGADEFSGLMQISRRSLLVRRILLMIGILFCDRVAAVSQNDARNIMRAAGPLGRVAGRKIVVAGHPIDVPRELPARFPEKKWQAVTICWMGSEGNVIRKGLIQVVDFIAELDRRGNDLPLLVIGSPGPGTQLLRRAAEAAGIASKIRIVGAATEAQKWELLAQSTVYFQLSQYEGFGVAALEALRCGCVVVHTGNGALEETIGGDGLRVDVSALRELAPTFGNAVTSKLASLRIDSEQFVLDLIQRFSPERRARALLDGAV